MKKVMKLFKRGTALCLTVSLLAGLVPCPSGASTEVKKRQESANKVLTEGVAKSTDANRKKGASDKTIAGVGTDSIKNPTEPTSKNDAWKGSYVYYGNYDADGDGTAEPVKYRVLANQTTDFSAADAGGNKAATILLDCDSVLYKQAFASNSNEWATSPTCTGLNGADFFEKDGVFTTIEKDAVLKSKKSEVNVLDGEGDSRQTYRPLDGDRIFLLDSVEATRLDYGYFNKTSTQVPNYIKKFCGTTALWWLRSYYARSSNSVGYVDKSGFINFIACTLDYVGVSPALNVRLSDVLFSSAVSGTAGETDAEYKLTLLDNDLTIAPKDTTTHNSVKKEGNTITVSYEIGGKNSANATQASLLILDKEYTKGNTNKAAVLHYQKLTDISGSANGTVSFEIPSKLSAKKEGTDYYAYIVAEDVNGEKETDYASEPAAIHFWEAPTVKQMNFGIEGIVDPSVPSSTGDVWKGCYVYYGNYNGSPVKYRVLDAETTDYSKDAATKTMLLDCDSVLYKTPFDGDAPYSNVWRTVDENGTVTYDSPICEGLNGKDFLNKDGAFTAAEKSAIADSKKDNVNEKDGAGSDYLNYVPLNGEKIFLPDAKEATRGGYGYSETYEDAENRKKSDGATVVDRWLRSSSNEGKNGVSVVDKSGWVGGCEGLDVSDGVSPAFNLNLSSVLFSSAAKGTSGFAGKASSLVSASVVIGTTNKTEWKLTLLDKEKTVVLTKDRNVTKAADGTITVPYTYTDKDGVSEGEKVNQISVMITDKAYKSGNSEGAEILYYGALDSIKDTDGADSTVTAAKTGTGDFELPSGLAGKVLGTDYHIYLLAEHVNKDDPATAAVDESMCSDYAGAPFEVKEILNMADAVSLSALPAPVPEQTLAPTVSAVATGAAVSAAVIWKKSGTAVSGTAEWNTTYQAEVKLTPEKGSTLVSATDKRAEVTLNGIKVTDDKLTWNADGTVTVDCGTYTTAVRKVTKIEAPSVASTFGSYHTAADILTAPELSVPATASLEGKQSPVTVSMAVD